MKLHSRASPNAVIKAIMKNANGIGTSKTMARQTSSLVGQNGHKTSSKYHSVQSAKNLRTVSTQLINHIQEKYEGKVLKNITRETVKDFILTKSLTIKGSSLNTYISNLAKGIQNLNELTIKTISPVDIYNLRKELKNEGITLSKVNIDRAAKNPEAIVKSLENNSAYGLSGRLAYEAGLRISDATNSSKWTINEDAKTLTITGSKGGITYQTSELSDKLLEQTREAITNNYKVNNDDYSRELKEAVEGEGEKWNGSHFLRYNHTQELYNRLHEQNIDYELNQTEQAILSEVSMSLGHSRTEITLHYLHI